MKSALWKCCLLAGVSCCVLFGPAKPAFAQEENRPKPDQRLEQLERRVNQLAERQERMMRRFDALQDLQAPLGRPGPEEIGPSARPPAPYLEVMNRVAHRAHNLLVLVALACMVCNILLAVWIATDIRKRGEGSGIFIALAILAGIPAAIIYSLARIGDRIPIPPK